MALTACPYLFPRLHLQPTRAQFVAERGLRGQYHYNAISSWRIDDKGEAANVYA